MNLSRRGPLVAGIAAAVVALLAIFFLVLPKRGQVAEVKDQLASAQQLEEQLQLQVAQLEEDKAAAPQATKEIREIDTLIPPTVDQEGMLLLLSSAADRSGCDFLNVAPSVPVPSADGTYSLITTAISVTGTYFQIEEFLFNLETLPRATKVTTLSLAAAGGATSELALQISADFYTTDISSGPGSIPGPSEESSATGATGASTTTTETTTTEGA